MPNYINWSPSELRDARSGLLKEWSNLEGELDNRRAQGRHVMRIEEQDWSEEGFHIKLTGPAGKGAPIITPELGFNVHNVGLSLLEVPPGSEEGAYHTHGEAIKYYISGEGIEIIGDKTYKVKAGDCVFIPANVWHGTQNNGTEPIRIAAFGTSHVGMPLIRTVVQGSIDEALVDGPPETHIGPGKFPQKEYANLDATQLYRRRKALLRARGKFEEELNIRRSQGRHVMKVEEQDWTTEGFYVKLKGMQGRGATLIAPELGFDIHNITATLLELPPGSTEGAYHKHGEAIKFYLRGTGGTEIVGDKTYEMRPGDTAFIPANVWHGTENRGTEPVLILAIAHSLAPLIQHHHVDSIDDLEHRSG